MNVYSGAFKIICFSFLLSRSFQRITLNTLDSQYLSAIYFGTTTKHCQFFSPKNSLCKISIWAEIFCLYEDISINKTERRSFFLKRDVFELVIVCFVILKSSFWTLMEKLSIISFDKLDLLVQVNVSVFRRIRNRY